MSKRQIIILLGVWVAVLLFLGFPDIWQKILAVATGIYLIVLAYSLRADAPKTTDLRVPFIEHKATEVKEAAPTQAAPVASTPASTSSETNQPTA